MVSKEAGIFIDNGMVFINLGNEYFRVQFDYTSNELVLGDKNAKIGNTHQKVDSSKFIASFPLVGAAGSREGDNRLLYIQSYHELAVVNQFILFLGC